MQGLSSGTSGKECVGQCWRHKRRRFDPCIGKVPRRRAWQSTPVFLPGESHGQRSLVGSQRVIGSQIVGHDWSDLTYRHTASAGDWFSIPGLERSPGEGNGNPFQYSCLGNSVDLAGYSPWSCISARYNLATKQKQLGTQSLPPHSFYLTEWPSIYVFTFPQALGIR